MITRFLFRRVRRDVDGCLLLLVITLLLSMVGGCARVSVCRGVCYFCLCLHYIYLFEGLCSVFEVSGGQSLYLGIISLRVILSRAVRGWRSV